MGVVSSWCSFVTKMIGGFAILGRFGFVYRNKDAEEISSSVLKNISAY